MIINPYQQLHHEFTEAGAKLLLSSGQACVLYGIAAFSKDGDWIIEESDETCKAILAVLERKSANYRLGAPLDITWLSRGWTSHFEYQENNIRMRVDFCSRPPRIQSIKTVWSRATHSNDVDLVDVETLIQLKKTRRPRDYAVIGALAEVLGYKENIPEIALEYLQDYDVLKEAIEKWPDDARRSSREAIKLLLEGKNRKDVVIALAIEQDDQIQKDNERIRRMAEMSRNYKEQFVYAGKKWKAKSLPLLEQHGLLIEIATEYLTDYDR
jgi:hypothetical protein